MDYLHNRFYKYYLLKANFLGYNQLKSLLSYFCQSQLVCQHMISMVHRTNKYLHLMQAIGNLRTHLPTVVVYFTMLFTFCRLNPDSMGKSHGQVLSLNISD